MPSLESQLLLYGWLVSHFDYMEGLSFDTDLRGDVRFFGIKLSFRTHTGFKTTMEQKRERFPLA